MSDAKRERRERMGDTNKVSKSNASFNGAPPAQPLPGAYQDGRGGNVMNNPQVAASFNEMTGSFSGYNLYPYGDDGLPNTDGRMGAVGYAQNSGKPQWKTSGRGLNIGVEDTMAPDFRTQEMMQPMEQATSAQDFAMRNSGVNRGEKSGASSYIAGPMGMMAYPGALEGGDYTPGSVDPLLTTQSDGSSGGSLGLQGVQHAEQLPTGMNTGTGARKSQPPKK